MTTSNSNKVTLPRTPKGKRPSFFDDPSLDQMMTFILELTTEVAVLRERQDTVERLLDDKGTISRADIEAYRVDDVAEAERENWRAEYIERVLRMHGSD